MFPCEMARYIAGFQQEARKYGRFWGLFGPQLGPAGTARDQIATPAVFTERRADLPLPIQSDHQPKGLFYRLFPGCMSASLLGFGHQGIIDLDIDAHNDLQPLRDLGP
jgi:hypothetical protein